MSKKSREKKSDKPGQQKPLRLWPGVVAAFLLLVVKLFVPKIMADALPVAIFGGLFFGFVIIIWWLFFSRAPHIERWSALILMIVSILVVRPFLHASIAKAGMGMLFSLLALPIVCLAFVVWAVVSRRFSVILRRVTMVLTIIFSVGAWLLLRTGGITHDGDSDFAWRWSQSPEEQLLAQTADEFLEQPLATTEEKTANEQVISQTVDTQPELSVLAADEENFRWSGFRGMNRDGIIHGVQIETNWSVSPPDELWRQPIGPGWSSFAVQGDLFYTQEQRGDDEVVSCYNLITGEPVWRHNDEVRFWESNSGAGPRGTPTLNGDRIYAFGGTGILNVLDAAYGQLVWSRNAATDTDTKIPIWGFASSPLILENKVIVAAAGSLVAYDLSDGELLYSRPAGGDCYSSPQIFDIDGINQILLQNETGVISVSPSDGQLLWEFVWPGNPIVQPAQTMDGDILISVDDRNGIRRIKVTHASSEWSAEEIWSSDAVKPYFNDSVIHNAFVYGFDGRSLACIDVNDGTNRWKGGKYGRGQLLLLADQNLLLVISDKGDLALVEAVPDQFTELARFPAIKGKTWNHPVLVGDILLVRNAQEMAAFRLAAKSG